MCLVPDCNTLLKEAMLNTSFVSLVLIDYLSRGSCKDPNVELFLKLTKCRQQLVDFHRKQICRKRADTKSTHC